MVQYIQFLVQSQVTITKRAETKRADAGATMKRIAEATNLSYGLVYHYFPSKGAVLRYIIDASFDGSVQAATAILTASGAARQKIV